MKRKTSIKYRILRLSIISVAVVLLIFPILLSAIITTVAGKQYKNELLSLSHAYSNNLSTIYDTIAMQIEGVAENNCTTKEQLEPYLHNTYFKDFSIAKPDGTTLNNTNISDRDYFQHALNGETYISAPLLRKTDDSVTTMVGTKMPNGNVLYGAIDWHILSMGLSAETLGTDGVVIVVDAAGQIVASSNEDIVQNITNALSEDFWLSNIVHKEGHHKISNNGASFYAYSEEFGDHGWSIVTVGNLKNTTNSIISSMVLCVIISIVLMALEVFISIFVSNKITKPLKDTALRLKMLAEGDINSNVTVHMRRDETQVLTEALNESIGNLRIYISAIQSACNAMSEGDFSSTDTSEFRGDFITIGRALNGIETNIGGIVAELKSAANDVTAGSVQIAEGATTLAEGCTRQATAIDQINASMQNIANDATDTANKVNEAEALASTSNYDVSAQMEAVTNMTNAMADIQDKADKISAIVKTIEGIAFQTNILALNASIEAARAGEAGKGFAVVANEVRELAGKSADATNTTANLISETVDSIHRGTSMVEVVAEKMTSIRDNTEKIGTLMATVADASTRQTTAIQQITSGIKDVSDVVQLNSATAEETAASCEELSSQANVLNDQVGRLTT